MSLSISIGSVKSLNSEIESLWVDTRKHLNNMIDDMRSLRGNVRSSSISSVLSGCETRASSAAESVNKTMVKNTEFGDFLMHEYANLCQMMAEKLAAIAEEFNSFS